MNHQFLLVRSALIACLCTQVMVIAFADPEAVTTSKDDKAPTAAKKSQPATGNKNKALTPNKTALKNIEINAQREQSAIEFAKQHHPELVALITPLKESNPKEYQRAVKDLFRDSERLSGVREKDPARYELELERWKLQSQIRLLAARLTMSEDSELEAQLREALTKKAVIQLKLLEHERETLEKRLQQVQGQIEKHGKSREQLVQQEYDQVMKKSKRDRPAARSTGAADKPAGKKSKPAKTTDSQ